MHTDIFIDTDWSVL